MAFKKPLHDAKTSAPLRSSDRKKLKQRVLDTFMLKQEDGDALVPGSLLSMKFNTHLDEPGVMYISPEGDPLWFSLGKASNDLIPTVYTLWKRPTLLPALHTPSAVIPILMGGADLMIPGVARHPPHVERTDLVAIVSRVDDDSPSTPPLAVGRMAVRAEELREGAKGKAVYILHTFGDYLWGMGSKAEPPDVIPQLTNQAEEPSEPQQTLEGGSPNQTQGEDKVSEPNLARSEKDSSPNPEYEPQEVTAILRSCTMQAIQAQLSKLPISSFPISSSNFYSNYILPSRPLSSLAAATPIDIKHSSHKNLTSFLKSLDKDGLLRLKDIKGDLNVVGVNSTHPEVQCHVKYPTIGDKAKREEKRVEREKIEKQKVKEIAVRELWKPHVQSIHFFNQIGKDIKELYSIGDLRVIIDEYAAKHSLVNPYEQQYIQPDELLLSVLVAPKSRESLQYVKRDDAVKRLSERMQSWHEILPDGKDPILRKGRLNAITVVVKVRQGRKASTLITGFETFLITPEFLSEELKRICATSTSVSPVAGKGNSMEVLVQGKQIKAVTELLVAQGVPKKWIESTDLTDKK